MTKEQYEAVQSVIEGLPNYYEVEKLEVGDFAKLGWMKGPSSLVKILKLNYVSADFCYITYMHVGYGRKAEKGYYCTHAHKVTSAWYTKPTWVPRGGQDYYTFSEYNAPKGFNCYGDIFSEVHNEMLNA